MAGTRPMLVGFAILLLALIFQGIAFSTPGWTTVQVTEKTPTIHMGLWMMCEGQRCKTWINTQDDFGTQFSRLTTKFDNIDINLWVTQTSGLLLLFIAMVMAAFASCCLQCCKGKCGHYAKYFILSFSMLGSMSILIGVASFGTIFADRTKVVPYKDYKIYELNYSFGLAAVASIFSFIGGLVTLCSSGKPEDFII